MFIGDFNLLSLVLITSCFAMKVIAVIAGVILKFLITL